MSTVNPDVAPAPNATITPKVEPDTRLTRLLKDEDTAKGKVAATTVAIIDYLKNMQTVKGDQTTSIVVATFLASGRAKTKESARSMASQYLKYLKPEFEEQVDLLRAGKITVRALREAKRLDATGAGRKAKTPNDKYLEKVSDAANWYVARVLPDPNAQGSKEAFLAQCEAAFDFELQSWEAEKAAHQGEFEANQEATK
jgi:hypothetical protein